MSEHGGPRGPANSNLDRGFTCFSLIRLHAIFHDGLGFMKSIYDVGPGCVFALSENFTMTDCMFIKTITGLTNWFHMEAYKSSDYKNYCL